MRRYGKIAKPARAVARTLQPRARTPMPVINESIAK